MATNTLLDVDESIIEAKLRLPQKNKEETEFNELIESFSKKEPPSILIKPSPGACIKVRTEDGGKTFINICTSNELPAPEDISQEKLVKLCMEDDQSYIIPLSIGNERLEADKGGSPVPTYDVAINTEYFEKCRKIQSFWVFTVTVIIDGVSNKFNKFLNPKEHLVLKNRKVIGKLQEHRIEKRAPRKPEAPKTLIEELSSNKSWGTSNSSKDQEPLEYAILESTEEAETGLIGLFKIPSLAMKNVILEVGEDRLVVEDRGSHRCVDIFLPCAVDQEHVSASMDSDIGVLRVYLPPGKEESRKSQLL